MSVLQISYCVQNIHCMLEAQAPTEVENVESSLGCQSTATSKCCLKSEHTELAMSTVLFFLPTGVALHDSKFKIILVYFILGASPRAGLGQKITGNVT